MDEYRIEDHPDLQDAGWARDAVRRAEREARARRLRSLPRRPRRRFWVGLAIVVAAALLAWAVFETNSGSPAGQRAVDLDEPFAGTTAAPWADGAAGVVVPEARQVGTFPADQVEAAYQRVREAVVAARLDRRVVQEHDLEPFFGLFAPDLRDSLRVLFDGRNDGEAALVVTRVAEGSRLAEVEPKVRGEMAAEAGPGGELVVRTDYTFAYAFTPDRPEAVRGPMDVVALSRFQVRYAIRTGDPGVTGLWADASAGSLHSIACSAAKRGYLAPAFTEPSLPPGLDFDLGAPSSPADGCPD
ncbi:hypothetical protein ALI22I_28300 [Saccharothrix sp. ALI-22-I]|uniref:hypothetical protein n=1 Tax=Saccharothrix sp. ALI-22-I TaxID=1933778 RepID=UPI00097BE905|nr:hypothetical protein [Saccharothrix sp. ALI-22-I]ONI85671.1 hypothetical protein ALI22I_28300 [Saccharothrix sp. ALI-22-I]